MAPGQILMLVLVVALVALIATYARTKAKAAKVASIVVGVVLAACVALVAFLYATLDRGPIRPADMDETTYDLCIEAIEVGEGYVSGTTTAADANRRISAIYDELEAYAPTNSTKHTLVSSTVLNIQFHTNTALGTDSKADVQSDIDTLRGYLD